MTLKLITTAIAAEDDVVRARQLARTIAGALGYPGQDQTRIATAVSEIARNAFMYARGGKVAFSVNAEAVRPYLEIAVEDSGPGVGDLEAVLAGSYVSRSGMGLGIRGARRLMDEFAIDSASGTGTKVVLRKYLARRSAPVTQSLVAEIARQLAAEMPLGALAEMREQNRELIESLDELRLRQEELAQLNAELADTNRGVVALYAELDEKAEHLRRASEMKTRFLSNMTHELRTPINSILALSRLLQSRADGDLTVEQERQVAFIRNSAETLSEIINDLLDLAKVEAGKAEIRLARFTAAELFGALRGMFKPLLRDEVMLVIDEPSEEIELHSDQGKLSQILRNFVSNALKFTERGQVRVSAALDRRTAMVTFTVRDTGIGIAKEHIDYIFEEFTQLENEFQTKAKGTGLGLPLSRRLAGLLGGTVAVDSAPGHGATFSVAIPRVMPGLRETEAESRAAPEPARTRDAAPSVLIVDDDEASRYVMRQAVLQLGGEVQEAANAAEGLALAYRDRPQLILMDLRMPGMDGFSMLQQLGADPRTSAIPVVVVTSSEVAEPERSRLVRARAVLSKADFSAKTVATLLSAEIRRDRQRRADECGAS
jgi:signal transduction histidine kinase